MMMTALSAWTFPPARTSQQAVAPGTPGPLDGLDLGFQKEAKKTGDFTILSACQRCSGTGKCSVCWGAGHLMVPIVQLAMDEADKIQIPQMPDKKPSGDTLILRECTMCSGSKKCFFCSGTGEI